MTANSLPDDEPKPAEPLLPELQEFLNTPGLGQSLKRLGESIKERGQKEGEAQRSKTEAPEQPTAKIIQLDFWEDEKRAAPNAVFRSALFPALNNKQPRRYIEEEKLFSVSGVDVIFTGKQFDQTDLDVYLELLNRARPLPLGTPIKFSAYSLLKDLGRDTGKSQHQWLHSVLIRLRGGTIDMTDHKKRYFGGLIEGGFKDELTKQYEISINPKFAVLFGFGMWATIDRDQRRALSRNSTAKALHAYYSTHAAPGPHRYDTLAQIAGLTGPNPRKLKASIIKAHAELERVGFLAGYEPKPETIEARPHQTPGQIRHLSRQTSQKPRT
ncbi:MAG: plasmid replication initiator TrfA [Azonexus sp.]